MKNDKKIIFFLMLFCIFILSVIFAAFDIPFSDMNSTDFDFAYAIGAFFANMLKVLFTVVLCYLAYRKLTAISE